MLKSFYGIIFHFTCFILLSACASEETTDQTTLISSSPAAYWSDLSDQVAVKSGDEGQITIFTDSAKQAIDGFGGCFNELGWQALSYVTESQRDSILLTLFDTQSGCAFNICRMPIGANDYALDWYSHDETPGDYDMSEFNIDRDKKYLIPYIKSALEINPGIKIWGSPWSPPSWMKTNKHYACKPDPEVNDLSPERAGAEMQDQFIMDQPYLDAYALYFSKFINAYEEEGINIYAVHVQNEPNSCQNFPSCTWTPSSLATFIGDHLGPHFEQNGLNKEIWLGTIERPQPERVDTILQDPEAAKYIDGVGFQWAGKGVIPHVNELYPDLPLMQTETVCGNGSNDWAAAENTLDLMKHYFEHGANSYMYWNMVLDETGKSQWGWKQNSMITIDSQTGNITYNPEYYLMRHFSAYVPKDSKYLSTNDSNTLAFDTPEGTTIFYYNKLKTPEAISFQVENQVIQATLPAESFNTIMMLGAK